MTRTDNLGLVKEGADDFYNIETLNGNIDKIDSGFRRVPWFGVCGSDKDAPAKEVDLEGFKLFDGARVVVYFSYGNMAENMTLDVNGTGAAPVHYNGEALPAGCIKQAGAVELVYYWNYWRVVGDLAGHRADMLEKNFSDLRDKVNELETRIAVLNSIFSAEKIHVDAEEGKLWNFYSVDSIGKKTASEDHAKCAEIPLEYGAKYTVITHMLDSCKYSFYAVMEVLGNPPNYGINGKRLVGKGGRESFMVEPMEGSTYLLVNSCGSRADIEVYKYTNA